MVRTGDILYNPQNRETLIFIQTGEDTGGELLQLEVSIAPGGAICHSLMHLHPLQQETLFIKSGAVLATIGASKRLYQAGESIHIPAGVAHRLENASGQQELYFTCDMRPALATAILYETAFALAQSSTAHLHKELPLLQQALTLHKYRKHLYLANYPTWLQRLLYGLLAPLALLLGYKAEKMYKRTSSRKEPRALLWG